MDSTLSYFVYSPPKSNSHGHGVRDKNIKRAVLKLVDSFVDSFNATSDKELQVTLHYKKQNDIEFKNAHATIKKLNSFLGQPKREWDSSLHEHMEHMENTITWESNERDIFDILEYIEQIKSESILPLSKFWISTFYHYGKSPEPHGSIMCSIESGRLFVRLRLILPFSIDDNRCCELLSKFQSGLPFKLNGNHFRRIGPSKNGYGQWKLNEETQKRLEECLSMVQKKG